MGCKTRGPRSHRNSTYKVLFGLGVMCGILKGGYEGQQINSPNGTLCLQHLNVWVQCNNVGTREKEVMGHH